MHLVTVEELEERLGTSIELGLTQAQAAALLIKEGKNILSPPKELPLAVKFILFLFEGFGLLLWAGAILCFIAWCK